MQPHTGARADTKLSMADLSSSTQEPISQYLQSRSGWIKRFLYCLVRPLLHRCTRRYLSREMLSLARLHWVLPERGFPIETRRRWPAKYLSLKPRVILVLGTGSGWDTLTWASHRPNRMLAVEKYLFERHWQTVSSYARRLGLVTPDFLQADLGRLPVRSESVDLVVSDAVFEHCQDMPAVAREISRILSPGGIAYASYGPMWYCFGGDHFSGRGGLEQGYNHICLTNYEYRAYQETYETSHEDAQSGLRYSQLELFSKHTTREYLEIYASAGLEVADLILEVSREAVEFRQKWPGRFVSLLEAHPQLTADDLLVKGNLVILRKKSSGVVGRTRGGIDAC